MANFKVQKEFVPTMKQMRRDRKENKIRNITKKDTTTQW